MSERTEPGSNAGKRKSLRMILMGGGTAVVLVIVIIMYVMSGRYIGTDNAYIKSAKILISSEVAGIVDSVAVTDNQLVKRGDVLFTIERKPYDIALEKAQADLDLARAHVEQLKADYRQKEVDIARAESVADYNTKKYNRIASLVQSGAVSKESFDESKSSNQTAQKDIDMLKEELAGIAAELGGDPDISYDQHPSYKAALAALDAAKLELERTTIKAPVDGRIGPAPHKGDYARVSLPAMNMVSTEDVWIEANYKETEITHVVPGQPVEIEVDTYPGYTWHGTVDSISPATGSEFSVLPAQNATGNWVKVVQRIAVKIVIEQQDGQPDLRTGMSTHVTIDTGHYPHIPG